MTESASRLNLSDLSDFIASHLGLSFPRKRWRDLDRAMGLAAVKLGFKDAAGFTRWLLSSPPSRQHLESLASFLTVGETYFFREMRSVEVFLEHILPELISLRDKRTRHLRIWSAGCATGEEPYSIAILLDRRFPELSRWDVTLLATDLNPLFIQKAKEGLYGEWSFRMTPPDIKSRYFHPVGDHRFKVAAAIRKRVSFETLNLVEDPVPATRNSTGGMDVIFCRNVLMYFDTPGAGKAARLFHRSLTDDGWLIVSPSEASHSLFSAFAIVNYPDAILFRKPAIDSANRVTGGRDPKSAVSSLTTGETTASIDSPDRSTTIPFSTRRHPAPDPHEDTVQKIPELTDVPADLYLEALDSFERRLYGQAIEKALALLRHQSTDSRGMALLARAYANGGDSEKALEWCQKTITADKMNAAHYYLLATVLQEMDRIDAAAKALRKALYLNPDFVPAEIALGGIHAREGKMESSRKCFENALMILKRYAPDALVPESGGLTARSMMELIRFSEEKETRS